MGKNGWEKVALSVRPFCSIPGNVHRESQRGYLKEQTSVTYSTINRLIIAFDTAFQSLATQVSMAETERMAMLVHHAMESKTRTYHTTSHVFALCEGMNPRQVLAALFHDLVYYQLDDGFPLHTHDMLEPVAHFEGGTFTLQPFGADDAALSLCTALFNFEPGQSLPLYGGLNEFLSAVVAARLLLPYLEFSDLIAVIACIEATIAFRMPDAQGLSAPDQLALRVEQQYRRRYGNRAGHSPDALRTYVSEVVTDAVQVANRDVSSFSEADPGLFLSTTWLLIEESNAPLSVAGMYTLYEYRCGLTRMDHFLRNLNPASVFHQYQDQPSTHSMDDLRAAARRNIAFACDFLGAKITSIAIIEALALCTGTDGPISMFLGDIRNPYGRPARVEDFLPPVIETQSHNGDLLRVFERGRTLESSNDLTASPVTAFMYRCLGDTGTQHALASARQMFDGTRSPLGYLQSLDQSMVGAIIQACARVAVSRKDALLALEHQLK
jgi:hypothetical protein